MPLAPPLAGSIYAIDLAASNACLNTSIELMSGFGPPYARLIVLGREFERITSAFDDAFRQVGPNNDLKQKAIDRKMDDLLDRLGPVEAAIVATPARTIAGLYVKARAAIGHVKDRLIRWPKNVPTKGVTDATLRVCCAP